MFFIVYQDNNDDEAIIYRGIKEIDECIDVIEKWSIENDMNLNKKNQVS